MRYLKTGLLVSLCALPLPQLVAADPEVAAPPPPQVSPGSSATPAAAAPASPTTASPAAADTAKDASKDAAADAAKKAEELEKQNKRLRSQGYRAKVVNGTTLYCRGEVMLGSRFERQVCGTADELDRVAQESKDTVNDIQRRSLLNNPSKN